MRHSNFHLKTWSGVASFFSHKIQLWREEFLSELFEVEVFNNLFQGKGALTLGDIMLKLLQTQTHY